MANDRQFGKLENVCGRSKTVNVSQYRFAKLTTAPTGAVQASAKYIEEVTDKADQVFGFTLRGAVKAEDEMTLAGPGSEISAVASGSITQNDYVELDTTTPAQKIKSITPDGGGSVYANSVGFALSSASDGEVVVFYFQPQQILV